MGEIRPGLETQGAGNDKAIVEYWGDDFADLADDVAEFYALSVKNSGGSIGTPNREFNWPAYDEDSPLIDLPSDATVATNKITLPKTANLFGLVKDSVICDKNGEYYRVTANPAEVGNNYEISLAHISNTTDEKGYSNTEEDASSTLLQNARGGKLHYLYINKESGSKDQNIVHRILEDSQNVMSVFEDYAEVDRTRGAEKTRIGMNLLDFNTGKQAMKHARDIERSIWKSKGFNAVNRQSTKGFLNWNMIQRLEMTKDQLTLIKLIKFAEDQVMKKNRKPEIDGYCNSKFKTFIAEMALGNKTGISIFYDSTVQKDEFGFSFNTLNLEHVTIRLRNNVALKEMYEDSGSGILCCIDMDKVAIRHLEGNGLDWNTQIEYNTQQKAHNVIQNKIYTIGGGLQLESPQCHSVLLVKPA